MDGSAARDLAFALLSYGLLADLDPIVDQLLVIENKMLFQSRIRDPATLRNLLHRDVTVPAQQLHGPGISLFAPSTCAARQVIVQSQTQTRPFPKLQHLRIMRTQLPAEVRAAQSELSGDLRDVVFEIVHAAARRDRLLVFGMSRGFLPPALIHTDRGGFFRTAFDAVARKHQVAVVLADMTG